MTPVGDSQGRFARKVQENFNATNASLESPAKKKGKMALLAQAC